jgi:hypothetical protein
VFVIILADAKYVAPRLRNGRFHRYLIERNRRQRRRQARAVPADQGKNAVLRLGNRQIEWRQRTSIRGDLPNTPLPGDRNRRDLHSLPFVNQFSYLEPISMAIRIIDLLGFIASSV